MIFKRPGIDHDEVRPGMWATMPLRSEPVEIASWPCCDILGSFTNATIMVMITPGDCRTLREVLFKHVAVFHPSRWS